MEELNELENQQARDIERVQSRAHLLCEESYEEDETPSDVMGVVVEDVLNNFCKVEYE
jgi:hypothetical protein